MTSNVSDTPEMTIADVGQELDQFFLILMGMVVFCKFFGFIVVSIHVHYVDRYHMCCLIKIGLMYSF